MGLCAVCGREGQNRRVRVGNVDDRPKYESRVICSECEVALKKKPSPSKRGRKRDRAIPAPSTDEWIAALRRSWSIAGDCFRCELSGLKLDLISAHSPLALTCDHDPPGSGNFLVVAWLINDMKNDHDRSEFYRNISALAEVIGNGTPCIELADKYHASFANIKHWRRTATAQCDTSNAVTLIPSLDV
jgi:hypothetical protein